MKKLKKEKWLSYEEARNFVRSLNLKNVEEWLEYCKSGKKPDNIPSNVQKVYKDKGWTNWYAFLGKDSPRNWLPFKKARKFVRSLNLKSYAEWCKYCKSGKKPYNIPSTPGRVYRDKGWINWLDFLGKKSLKRNWLPFKEARKFARSLNLKSYEEWNAFFKSDKRPYNMPSSPHRVYKDKGWKDWCDFLGKEGSRNWMPFKKARIFARKLNLKSQKEWIEYCKSGKKPYNIPCCPSAVYKNTGWTNWYDFLGKEKLSQK